MKATEVDDSGGNVTSVRITYPDGSEVGFGDNNGTFTPPLGRFATLTALPNHGGYTLTDKTDTTYTFSQATTSGVFAISSITDYQGNKETFSYTAGQLATVTAGVSGRALHFTWSTPTGAQSAHVASVSTDPATAGQPSTALTWNYSYTGDQLTSVCPPTSPASCTSYAYTSGSHFPTAILDSGPVAYWRLGEASGGTAVDSVLPNEGVYNGTYSGVTLGQPGPLPGSSATSAQFNGTSSYVQLPASLAGNASPLTGSNLSIGLWFKTTAAGGVLFGSSSNPISGGTTTGAYVPNLYVGSDGKLNGELWGTSTPIASTCLGRRRQLALRADHRRPAAPSRCTWTDRWSAARARRSGSPASPMSTSGPGTSAATGRMSRITCRAGRPATRATSPATSPTSRCTAST